MPKCTTTGVEDVKCGGEAYLIDRVSCPDPTDGGNGLEILRVGPHPVNLWVSQWSSDFALLTRPTNAETKPLRCSYLYTLTRVRLEPRDSMKEELTSGTVWVWSAVSAVCGFTAFWKNPLKKLHPVAAIVFVQIIGALVLHAGAIRLFDLLPGNRESDPERFNKGIDAWSRIITDLTLGVLASTLGGVVGNSWIIGLRELIARPRRPISLTRSVIDQRRAVVDLLNQLADRGGAISWPIVHHRLGRQQLRAEIGRALEQAGKSQAKSLVLQIQESHRLEPEDVSWALRTVEAGIGFRGMVHVDNVFAWRWVGADYAKSVQARCDWIWGKERSAMNLLSLDPSGELPTDLYIDPRSSDAALAQSTLVAAKRQGLILEQEIARHLQSQKRGKRWWALQYRIV